VTCRAQSGHIPAHRSQAHIQRPGQIRVAGKRTLSLCLAQESQKLAPAPCDAILDAEIVRSIKRPRYCHVLIVAQ
jgi:hypothetical protein